jgi:hypothetical protein
MDTTINRKRAARALRALVAGLLLGGTARLWAAPDLSLLNVYPNPAREARGDTAVAFDNLTDSARIRIFTPGGDLVREAVFNGPGALWRWDLANDAGEPVVSGVYIYVVTHGREKRSGKLALIR